jgi:hypothetical protein
MPLLEETPPDAGAGELGEKMKDPPRNREEALVRLIDDEDPALSAAAIHFVGQQKPANLAAELERVLCTRDVKDWYVFEAASWALAAYRMPEIRRGALWLEPLPAVEVAVQLRRLPLFESVPVDELFRIAGAGRQLRCEPGRLLYQEAVVPGCVQFLLNGTVAVSISGGEIHEVRAPAAPGFQEVLEGRPMRATIRTTETTVCLALSNEECRALLGDNIELLEGIFRMLCDGGSRQTGRLVLKGNPQHSAPHAGGDLKLIEKILILKAIPVFRMLRLRRWSAWRPLRMR